jgi:hypothetical protein
MTQAIIGTLLMGLGGLLWVIVRDFLGDGHRTHDKKNVIASPECKNEG